MQDMDQRAARLALAPPTEEGTPPPREPPASVTKALKALVDFIPTETITLFWLAIPLSAAAWEKWHGTKPTAATDLDWIVFWSLFGVTPLLLMLVFLSGLASANKPKPKLGELPWWRAIASLIAFPSWTFAVPGNPFVRDPVYLMGMWFVATFVSMLLGLLDPIVTKWCCKSA